MSWHPPTPRTPDGEGFWVVTRHADVSTVLRDPVTFSSDRGGIRDKGGTAIKDERTAGTMLNQTDDPQHQRLRTLVNRGFTPRAVAALTDELRRRGAALLDAAGDEPFDFVHGFARELPSQAICLVLGVPAADQPALLDWLDAGIEADSPSILSPDAMRKIRDYAVGLIAAKRADPDEAIMSTIVHARDDAGSTPHRRRADRLLRPAVPGRRRDDAQRHRRRRARLRRAPGRARPAARRPDADPVGRRGDRPLDDAVGLQAAHRQPRRRAGRRADRGRRQGDVLGDVGQPRRGRLRRPDRFDVGRSPNPHLGFGWGAHFCLGASLARLEIRVTLELLLERDVRVEQVGPIAWMPNNRLFGLKHLPVRLVPAA